METISLYLFIASSVLGILVLAYDLIGDITIMNRLTHAQAYGHGSHPTWLSLVPGWFHWLMAGLFYWRGVTPTLWVCLIGGGICMALAAEIYYLAYWRARRVAFAPSPPPAPGAH